MERRVGGVRPVFFAVSHVCRHLTHGVKRICRKNKHSLHADTINRSFDVQMLALWADRGGIGSAENEQSRERDSVNVSERDSVARYHL